MLFICYLQLLDHLQILFWLLFPLPRVFISELSPDGAARIFPNFYAAEWFEPTEELHQILGPLKDALLTKLPRCCHLQNLNWLKFLNRLLPTWWIFNLLPSSLTCQANAQSTFHLTLENINKSFQKRANFLVDVTDDNQDMPNCRIKLILKSGTGKSDASNTGLWTRVINNCLYWIARHNFFDKNL